MIKRIRVIHRSEELFELCWSLYIGSFPYDERRDEAYHLQTIERKNYLFEAIYDDDLFVGILGWWDFEDVRYIEHFAITPSLRSGGYGRRVLESFMVESDKMILLEVEHPVDELQRRRIGFYERLGFKLNDHHYSHPAYHIGDSRVSLLIMTYPEAISQSDLTNFTDRYLAEIHFLA